MQRTHGVTHYEPDTCFGCKLLSVQFGKSTFEPHYNYAVGKFVSSEAEFRDALRKCSDKNSEATGITHNYEPVHPSDLVRNAPPESAPDLLPALSDGIDPTAPDHRDLREQKRAKDKAKADRDAATKDLIHKKKALVDA